MTQLGLGNSAAFDGTGDYLGLSSSSDFDFGTGDFAIDFWVKFNAVSIPSFMGYVGGTGQAWYLSRESNNLIMQYYNGSSWSTVSSATWNPSTGVWYHVAITRSSGTVNDYVNGVRIRSDIFSTTISNGARDFGVGAGGGAVMSDGNLDELRIIKGRALTPEEIKAAASRRPYAVYTSPVVDAATAITNTATWDTVNWTEGG